MSIIREATKIISRVEMRIRRAKKLPFSNKYVFRLIRGDKRAKVVMNEAMVKELFPHTEHIDLLAKQNASLFLGVIGHTGNLEKALVKRMPKDERRAANDAQYDQKKAA